MGNEEKRQVGADLVTLAEASQYVAKKAFGEQDWSGLPMPVPGLKLVLEPRYKHQGVSEFRWKECYDQDGVRHPVEAEERQSEPSERSEYRVVNSWWNSRYQLKVIVLKDKAGLARFTIELVERLAFTIRTMEAAAAWPIEAEQKAQKKLATLIHAESFEVYQLTGHFAEVSKRSQVLYLFRRGRPTIALRQDREAVTALLCALCLHPIGYYGDTWAGVMCPTDEVIAHLLMMRGCEEKYWANANQHPLDHPTAGV